MKLVKVEFLLEVEDTASVDTVIDSITLDGTTDSIVHNVISVCAEELAGE